MKQIENVLLDIDGTLIDSNEQHARAWVKTLDKLGYHQPLSHVRLLIGMGGDKILKMASGGKLSDAEIEKISKKRDEEFVKEYWGGLKPFPGAYELLQALHTRGYRVVFATSMGKELLERVFTILPFAKDFILGCTGADDVQNSKPDPDIFAAAVRRFGLDRNRTAVIGDSPYDIEAARNMGCKSIAVLTGRFPVQMLATADETHVDLHHLLRSLDKSLLTR
jgi:HAD superfamily hydrolase (TIGR01509 family)